jgi:hypothetical protein
MAVRSALRAGRPLPPGRFLVLISVKRLRAIARLEGIGKDEKRISGLNGADDEGI